MKLKIKYFVFFFSVYFGLIAQNQKSKSYYLVSFDEKVLNSYDKYILDSLLPLYHKTSNDTLKFKILKNFSSALSDERVWIPYNNLLFDLTKGKTDSMSLLFHADALNNRAYQYQYLNNDLDSALYFYGLSCETAKLIGNKVSLGIALNNIAYIHQHRGNLEKCIVIYNESYKLFLEVNFFQGIISSMVNLGDIYYKNEDYTKAEECFNKALKHALEDKQNFLIGNVYYQLATIQRHNKNLSKSFYYLNKAIDVYTKQSDFNKLALMYMQLGENYTQQKDKDNAKSAFDKSLQLLIEVTDLSVKSRVYDFASGFYFNLNETEKAKTFADSAYSLAKRIGYPQQIYNSAAKLSEYYFSKKQFDKAYLFLKEATVMKDSLNNDKIKKSVLQQQFKSDYEKKEIQLKAEQQKKDAERKAEKKRQQYVLYGTLVVLAALLIVIYVVYRNYASKKKSALVLEEKNKIIYSQKQLVEEKQKEILDSINYAQKIQSAVLTGDDVWRKISQEYFILFQPKDIVSGDFYWAYNTVNSRAVFALADCTGHGVPGGFMSMLGNSFLNELVVENKIFNPAEILNKLRTKIISSLEQKGVTDRRDGMDMAICTWNKLNNTLEFAGANNKLWIIRNGSLIEYAGDKMPVGNYHGELKPFTLHEIKLELGDQIILSTDGFADQFGGEGSKKLMSKNLKTFIVNNSNLMLQQQKELLYNFLHEWKGKNEQVDDVSIISVKVV